jgi:adenosine deaminase
MHCDTDQENSLEHIRQCLEVIEVDRIDHGVNILESESLTADLRRRGLGLTVCPISNRWCTGDLKAEQIKRLLDLGVRVTVNSDDPAYFGGYVTDNFIATQQAAGLQVVDLVQLQRNAIEIAWLPATVREQLLTEIDQYRAGATEPGGP